MYRLPAEAVLYASALCVPVALFAFGIGGIAFDRRLRRLQRLKEQACVELSDLPEPRDAIDATYAAMLRLLWEEQRCLIQASRMQNAELLDYYTLWAHQIKTPIAAMRLLLQTQETDESAELRDALFQIEQYVEMVMQFLRTESMTGDWVVRTYDLDEIVRRAVHKYARQFIRKRLKLDYCPLRCAVLTDEKWLGFVI
ncbi:MAG: sensor histidine kinase, partial [Clostridia bacterium]